MSKRTVPPGRLPASLTGRPFSVDEAKRAGVSPKRLRSRDLGRPFAGVRSDGEVTDIRSRCRAYASKMSPDEFFSHGTAAVLHDMWLPLWLEERAMLDVSVVRPARAPRDRGVSGHHLVQRPRLVVTRDGFRVADSVETWCQLATVLPHRDLVVAGERLLAKDRDGVEEMQGRLLAAAADPNRPYSRRLGAAALRLRCGSRSAGESTLRLLLVDAGLPEPEMNAVVTDASGRFLGEADLVYRGRRVVIEYEGDYHRTDKKQWRKDIVRYERMQDAGWRVIRVTADDVRLRPDETVARVRAALAARRTP